MIRRLSLPLLIALIGMLSLFAPPAQADLLIMPLRVHFADRERSAELTLVNTSQTTNTYRLEWVNNRMNEDGSYTILDAPLNPAFDPEKNLVISPRQVTIPPGQQQRVRLSLRRPPDLPDGEYRAHLLMKKVGSVTRSRSAVTDSVEARVDINIGFSIPVIIQQGVPNVRAGLTDIKILPPGNAGAPPHLSAQITREGTHSINGRVRVFWTPPGGTEEQIGILNNINVFPEISRRHILVPLRMTRPLTGGTMRIALETMDSQGALLAQQVLPLQ